MSLLACSDTADDLSWNLEIMATTQIQRKSIKYSIYNFKKGTFQPHVLIPRAVLKPQAQKVMELSFFSISTIHKQVVTSRSVSFMQTNIIIRLAFG